VRNYSQAEIAGHCGISRQRVQRILADQRSREIVEVRIKLPDNIHTLLETELEDKFDVEEFVIVDSRDAGIKSLDRALGEAAADYLMNVMTDNVSIAITWSKVLLEMTGAISRSVNASYRKFKNVKIIQSMGALGESKLEFHSLEIAQRLAKIFGAKTYLLLAPVIAANPKTAKEFLREDMIIETLEEFRQASMFLTGIGSMSGESSLLRSGAVSPALEADLRVKGSVGDINAVFFDADGRHVRTELNGRLIGPTMTDLRSAKRLIAVAGGEKKYEAVRGVARGRLAKVVITDFDTGSRLVREK
jgi:DNA-binding transcriptional regulator LsrR (DeoR family)